MTKAAVSSQSMSTPKFENPPVVETIFGVHFSPVRRLKNAHLGVYWKNLDARQWPDIDEAAPVEPKVERFGEGVPLELQNISFHLTKEAAPTRLRIRNRDGDRMIQVQNGVFRYNWLGHKEQHSYPEFDAVKPEFERYYSGFSSFLNQEQLGDLRPQQWEISYINHIEKDTVWKTPQDLGSVFPTLVGSLSSLDVTGSPIESLGGQWCYVIGKQEGRLHVNLKHARKSDDREVFVLTLTARGPARNVEEIHAGIDLGHRTIVFAFKELTSPEAHQYWKIRND